MERNKNKTTLTTIGIDHSTNRQIDKLCKRYSLKKGEAVKLAFEYMDKASINPSEPPESVKSELAKINKRQDDLIRFVRHFEEAQLNPMVKATHAISVRFDTIVQNLESKIDSEMESSHENIQNILRKMDEVFGEQKAVTQDITKRINLVYNFQKINMNKLFQLIAVYAELAACGITDGKKKERLKEDIDNLINPKS
ncbi:clindamycin resistance transfer factor BtgA [Bacteroidia bacterium]|nr:clindamycin resistance transfer factor BtgA [Bacteroidia bacterium]